MLREREANGTAADGSSNGSAGLSAGTGKTAGSKAVVSKQPSGGVNKPQGWVFMLCWHAVQYDVHKTVCTDPWGRKVPAPPLYIFDTMEGNVLK